MIFGAYVRICYGISLCSFTIDHRTWKTGLPVRSAVLKPCAGRLVVGWVTTSEYLLLIVLHFRRADLYGVSIAAMCFLTQSGAAWDSTISCSRQTFALKRRVDVQYLVHRGSYPITLNIACKVKPNISTRFLILPRCRRIHHLNRCTRISNDLLAQGT